MNKCNWIRCGGGPDDECRRELGHKGQHRWKPYKEGTMKSKDEER
jgi:hypothetical protein